MQDLQWYVTQGTGVGLGKWGGTPKAPRTVLRTAENT